MKVRDGTVMLLLAAIWGTSFLLIRIAAPVLGPIVLVTARMLIAGSVLLLYAAVMRRPMLSRHAPWKAYLILGTINSLLPLTLEAVAVASPSRVKDRWPGSLFVWSGMIICGELPR